MIELFVRKCNISPSSRAYADFLSTVHDSVLAESLGHEQTAAYEKLYSYTTLLNAFAVKLNDPAIQVTPTVQLVSHCQTRVYPTDPRTLYIVQVLGFHDSGTDVFFWFLGIWGGNNRFARLRR